MFILLIYYLLTKVTNIWVNISAGIGSEKKFYTRKCDFLKGKYIPNFYLKNHIHPIFLY